jgi:hypothetical protein
MKALRPLKLALVLFLCFISLISFSWSAEKSKAPSSAVGSPTLSAPAAGMLPVRPFSIKVSDVAITYLDQYIFSLCARLDPGGDSQAAKEATVGKDVFFSVDGNPVGKEKTSDWGSFGSACLAITPNNAMQFQAGTHEVIAQARYGSSVIKGYGKLVVKKSESKIIFNGFMPNKQTYKLGETVTYRGILKNGSPIAHANVECTMRVYTVDNLNFVTSANAKTLFTVQTNNQGGFECPITLAPGVFDTVFKTQQCRTEYLGAYFSGNSNFNASSDSATIRVCP